MELIYKIDGIDCANCAAKLERQIAKTKGVKSAALEVEDASVEEAILAVIKKREPDATVKRV